MSDTEYFPLLEQMEERCGGHDVEVHLPTSQFTVEEVSLATAKAAVELCEGKQLELQRGQIICPPNERGVILCNKVILMGIGNNSYVQIEGNSARNSEGKYDLNTRFIIMQREDHTLLRVSGPHKGNHEHDCPRLTLEHVLYKLTHLED